MTTSIRLTIDIFEDRYRAEVEVTSTVLPAEIFYYKNTGTTSLGEFCGVVDPSQLVLYPKFSGTQIGTFAAPFVRSATAVQLFSNRETIDQWFEALKNDISDLKYKLETSFPVIIEAIL